MAPAAVGKVAERKRFFPRKGSQNHLDRAVGLQTLINGQAVGFAFDSDLHVKADVFGGGAAARKRDAAFIPRNNLPDGSFHFFPVGADDFINPDTRIFKMESFVFHRVATFAFPEGFLSSKKISRQAFPF